MSERPTCIIVTGVHRSGTSLLTGILSFLGAQPPKKIVAAGKFNLKGFWEPLEILRLNETILHEFQSNWEDWRAIDLNSWSAERRSFYKSEIKRLIAEDYPEAKLFVLKEPRLTRLIPLYHEALTEMGIDVVYALALREPDDVVGSIRAANPLKSKNGAYLLWLRYVLDSERDTRSQRRVVVSFTDLLNDWTSTCQRIAETLNVSLTLTDHSVNQKLNSFISADLVHHKSQSAAALHATGPARWAADIYALLAGDPLHAMNAEALESLDRIRHEFEQNWPNYADASEASRLHKRRFFEKLKREIRRAILKIVPKFGG